MKVDGQGPQGFVKATARIEIAAAGDQTRMTYAGDAHVGGRIASVGQRLMESSAKAIIKQSLEGLNTTLKAQIAAQAAGGDPPAAIRVYRSLDSRVCRQRHQGGGQGSGADAGLDRRRNPAPASLPLFHPGMIGSTRAQDACQRRYPR